MLSRPVVIPHLSVSYILKLFFFCQMKDEIIESIYRTKVTEFFGKVWWRRRNMPVLRTSLLPPWSWKVWAALPHVALKSLTPLLRKWQPMRPLLCRSRMKMTFQCQSQWPSSMSRPSRSTTFDCRTMWRRCPPAPLTLAGALISFPYACF